jgi:hypothetical protein
MEAWMEIECKWNSNFGLTKEGGSYKNFIDEIFTSTMKPSHCLIQKCQKFGQFASS